MSFISNLTDRWHEILHTPFRFVEEQVLTIVITISACYCNWHSDSELKLVNLLPAVECIQLWRIGSFCR